MIKCNSKTSDPNQVQSDSQRPIKQLSECTALIKGVSSIHKSTVILKDDLGPVVEAVNCPDLQSGSSICEQ